ncbi:unnamed protein product [Paramecium pentaurelia]|uniref:Uncharacterized protein n=1 Tax=Paramecium pentaurelia TaxID=43138 RepID=A0A8S1WKX6_9CILI|nr:unnamed protein product [Paramecium pentaurelia]
MDKNKVYGQNNTITLSFTLKDRIQLIRQSKYLWSEIIRLNQANCFNDDYQNFLIQLKKSIQLKPEIQNFINLPSNFLDLLKRVFEDLKNTIKTFPYYLCYNHCYEQTNQQNRIDP